MRIEDVTIEKLSEACDKELLILKLRFTQAWDRNDKNKSPVVVSEINKSNFLKRYRLLLDEMNTRKIEKSTNPIDKASFKKSMIIHKFGIDVSELDDIVLAKDYITIDATIVDDIIDFVKDKQAEITKDMSLDIRKSYECAYIPLYDLVLKAKTNTILNDISKARDDEHVMILAKAEYFKSDSLKITKGGLINDLNEIPDTISIIRGSLIKSKSSDPLVIYALRFSNEDWTQTKIKKWMSNNKIEFLSFEKAENRTKKMKKTSEKVETEKDKVLLFEKFVSIVPIEKDSDEHVVCGIIYEPDVEDAQGDMANEVEIRKAAHQFMEQVQLFKVMHKGQKVKVKVLESYLAPSDFVISNQSIKKGSWVMTVRVLDKKIWKDIKSGKLTGFSMAGYATSTVTE